MKPLLLALLVVVAGKSASADITIIDNHKVVAVDCAKDPTVTLVGNHIVATLAGTCAKVIVAGNHNTVTGSTTALVLPGNHNKLTLEGVDDIAVAGNHNKLSFQKALTLKAPRIVNVGNKNVISQAAAR